MISVFRWQSSCGSPKPSTTLGQLNGSCIDSLVDSMLKYRWMNNGEWGDRIYWTELLPLLCGCVCGNGSARFYRRHGPDNHVKNSIPADLASTGDARPTEMLSIPLNCSYTWLNALLLNRWRLRWLTGYCSPPGFTRLSDNFLYNMYVTIDISKTVDWDTLNTRSLMI